MSYAHINGAQIYYDTYGADPPARPRVPLLLIHGAGGTGQADWHDVIPPLARHYRVVVPDCRGHGRSTNPGHSYSFREIAEDLAELIRRLGYTRAHVVGHSNGGNVALVLLLEHSEVVQTCTLQAANAYVSSDIVDNMWRKYQPDAAAELAPEWVRQLSVRHAPMHGRDYWRELLELTLAETILHPDYTADDLALAARPVLVIQGAQDASNVPGRHGQFLARHIPDAEAWFPAGVGHSVHDEMPWAWTERLLSFLSRRGDEANDALDRMRRTAYADRRLTVFEVHAEYLEPGTHCGQHELQESRPSGNGGSASASVEPGADVSPGDTEDEAAAADEAPAEAACETCADTWTVCLTGQVLVPEQAREAVAAVSAVTQLAGTAVALNVQKDICVLLDERTPAGLLLCPLADLRCAPDGQAERISQVLLGQAVQLLAEQDGWTRVRLPEDGCLGWLESGTVLACDGQEAALFAASARAVVVAEAATAYTRPSRRSAHAGKLLFGTTLPIAVRQGRWAALSLPGGDHWWVPEADLLDLAGHASSGVTGADRKKRALKVALTWVGAPFLAGGRTPYGFDSAGLAAAFLRLLGLRVPCAVDRLYQAGRPVTGRPRPGDLVFFAHEVGEEACGRPGGERRISHVAVSLGGYRLLQAGGGALSVNVISLGRPRSPAALWLRAHLAGARRYVEDEW